MIISAKDWILGIWDILYGYMMDVYDILHQVYELIIEIPLMVVGFPEDISNKIIDEILDIVPC
jgi:hypothetical protein